MNKFFDDKSILVTGGTGSFGRKFTSLTLKQFNPKEIVIFSRDEMKQYEMMQEYSGNKQVRFVIGDVRDKDSIKRVLTNIDLVVHAAATKIVPLSEVNAFECVKTNINGSMNVIDASIESGVQKVVALSTDKASAPVNLYGATKLAADKLFIAANIDRINNSRTSFSIVRYGNVMGSRGSVIPFFKSLAQTGEIPLTDLRMTRFMITLEQAVELVWKAFTDSMGGEIYVKKIPSMKVLDIAKTLAPKSKIVEIGIRPGEKLHEQMIGKEDAPNTYEYRDYYKIMPNIAGIKVTSDHIKKGIPVDSSFSYCSDSNEEWMSTDELLDWLRQERYI